MLAFPTGAGCSGVLASAASVAGPAGGIKKAKMLATVNKAHEMYPNTAILFKKPQLDAEKRLPA